MPPLSQPMQAPLIRFLFASLVASALAVGLPVWLANREQRARRLGWLAAAAIALAAVRGWLPPVRLLRGIGGVALAAVAGALAARALAIRRLQQAILAERERSPDEWDGARPRLWAGALRAEKPCLSAHGLPCLYRRLEIERWDADARRWRPVRVREDLADAIALWGKSRSFTVWASRDAWRRMARAGGRCLPGSDARFRARESLVPNGSAARIFGRAVQQGRAARLRVTDPRRLFDGLEPAGGARLRREARRLLAAASLLVALSAIAGLA